MEDNKMNTYSDNYLKSCNNCNKAYRYLQTSKQILKDIEKIVKAYKEYTKDYQKKLTSLKANMAKIFYIDDCVKFKNDTNNYKTLNKFIKTLTDIITTQIKNISFYFPESKTKISNDNSLNILNRNKSNLEIEKKKMIKNFFEYDENYKQLLSKFCSSEDFISNYFVENRKNKKNNNNIFDGITQDITSNVENFKNIKNKFENDNSNFFELYDIIIKDLNDEINNYNTILLLNVIPFINNCFKYHSDLSKNIENFFEKNIIKENPKIIQDFNEFKKNNFSKVEKICKQEKYHVKAVSGKCKETKIGQKNKEIMEDLYDVLGLGEFKEEYITLTEEDIYNINKFFHRFEFVDLTDYDLKIEEKKILVKNLTNKILYFNLGNNLIKYPDLTEINEKELNDLYKLLENKQYRHVFLKRLNNYKSNKCFELPEKEFNIILKCIMISIDNILNDNDIFSLKLIIILSKTFFMFENKQKKYLYMKIYGHKIFQEKKIWTEYMKYYLNSEDEKFNDNKERNINSINTGEDLELSVDKAFEKISCFCNDMKEFGMNEEILREIISPITEKYKLYDGMKIRLIGIIEENLQKNKNN